MSDTKIIVKCDGYNDAFYQEVRYHFPEVEINTDFGVTLLIGDKGKLRDALINTFQSLFKNKLFYENTELQNKQFNFLSRHAAIDFVEGQWPQFVWNYDNSRSKHVGYGGM